MQNEKCAYYTENQLGGYFFPCDLVLDIEVGHGGVRTWLVTYSLESRKISCWLAEVNFLGTLAQGLWSLSKVSAPRRAWQSSAAPLPLRVGPLPSDMLRRAVEKRNSFQAPCVAGAQLFSPLSFPIYLDQ